MLRRSPVRSLPSFAVAAVFASAPDERRDRWRGSRSARRPLSTVFAIVAIWSWARHVRAAARGARAREPRSAFALSLLAKQTLRHAPVRAAAARLVAAAAHGHGRVAPTRDREAAVGRARGAACAATLAAQGAAIATGATFPLAVRLGNTVLAYAGYLAHFAWPTRLAVFYPLYAEDVTPGRVAACAALLGAITAAAFALRRERPVLLVGWLWFVGALVPVIGVVQVGAQAMADRYAYASFWGLEIALAWTVWSAVRASRAPCASVRQRLRGGLRLAREPGPRAGAGLARLDRALRGRRRDTDRNYVAERALAAQYFAHGDYALAVRHAEAGARYPRDLGEILPLYGMALYQTGAKADAIATLAEATRVAPRSAMGFSNLGWCVLQEAISRAHTRRSRPQSRSIRSEASRRTGWLGPSSDSADSTKPPRRSAASSRSIRSTSTRGSTGRGRSHGSVVPERRRLCWTTRSPPRPAFPADRRAQLVATLSRYRGEMLAAQGGRRTRAVISARRGRARVATRPRPRARAPARARARAVRSRRARRRPRAARRPARTATSRRTRRARRSGGARQRAGAVAEPPQHEAEPVERLRRIGRERRRGRKCSAAASNRVLRHAHVRDLQLGGRAIVVVELAREHALELCGGVVQATERGEARRQRRPCRRVRREEAQRLAQLRDGVGVPAFELERDAEA
jgi:hypothetical protein